METVTYRALEAGGNYLTDFGPLHAPCPRDGVIDQSLHLVDLSLSEPLHLISLENVLLDRIKCRKEGGVRFSIDGSGIFLSVLISNVGGAGDIVAMKIKGSMTGWLPMGRNWGQNWHINADLRNQPLSFELTNSIGVTLTSYNVAPRNWNFGQTFEGNKQFLS
ncbi:hypothetical protein LguiB_018840 [Lonicera macranthoides]